VQEDVMGPCVRFVKLVFQSAKSLSSIIRLRLRARIDMCLFAVVVKSWSENPFTQNM